MDRGQAHALEGVAAGILLLAGLLFALQSTVITPLSASTSNQHIENQQEAMAEGLLTTTAEDGSLKEALLFWGQEQSSQYQFHCASGEFRYYTGDPADSLCDASVPDYLPPTEFGRQLKNTFGEGIATNVRVQYLDSGAEKSQKVVFQGDPSDNAVRATTTVVLYDGDRLLASDGSEGPTLKNAEAAYFAPDQFDGAGEEIYNVVRVEVIIWRI